MFCVYGVSIKKCKKAAEKKVSALRGENAPSSASEYQEKVEELAQIAFHKGKAICVSGELATPNSVEQFITLAKKTGEYRALCGMRKTPKLDTKGNHVLAKGKQTPIYEWVPLEHNFTQELIDRKAV